MVVYLFHLHRLPIDDKHTGWQDVVPGLLVHRHILIPEEDVVDGVGGAVGPLDAFSYSEHRDPTVFQVFVVLREVGLDAVGKGAFVTHQALAERLVDPDVLDDVTGECTTNGSSVLADFFHRNNNEGFFRKAIGNGWELTANHALGKRG